MSCEFSNTQNSRRYRRASGLATLLYVGTVIGAATAIRNLDLPQWAIIALSLAPLAPALMALRAYLVFYRSMDEFQRRVQSEALIIATAFILLASFSYGFLEAWAGFPHLPLFWVVPAFCVAWGVATSFVRRRYK